jgi:hypothetical protein
LDRSWSQVRRAAVRILHSGARGPRRLTSTLRALPDFLVIGVQRGGTTSFYDALVRHPDVRSSSVKEVHYFDLATDRGSGWYRAHFPVEGLRGRPRRWLTGEATPYYLFHPEVPRRVRSLLPDVRLIALLRDPVERAWSHYRREVRLGRETLTFEQAIEREEERLAEEVHAFPDLDLRYAAPHHHDHAYQARGRYAEQLERWLGEFPRERLLVLRSEDFYADPGAALAQAIEFLGLPAWTPQGPPRRLQSGGKAPLDPDLRRRLAARFAEPSQRLRELLGPELRWP